MASPVYEPSGSSRNTPPLAPMNPVNPVAAAPNAFDKGTRKQMAELPSFHGDPAVDTISAMKLVQRIDTCIRTLGWDDATAYQFFEWSLKSIASAWIANLGRDRKNKKSWLEVKPKFLKQFGDLLDISTLRALNRKLDLVAEHSAIYKQKHRDYWDMFHDQAVTEIEVPPMLEDEDLPHYIQRVVDTTKRQCFDQMTHVSMLAHLPAAMMEHCKIVKPVTIPEITDIITKFQEKNKASASASIVHAVNVNPVVVPPVDDNSVEAVRQWQNKSNGFRGRFNGSRGRGRGLSRPQNNSQQNQRQNNQTSNDYRKPFDPNAKCVFCNRTGHSINDCRSRMNYERLQSGQARDNRDIKITTDMPTFVSSMAETADFR